MDTIDLNDFVIAVSVADVHSAPASDAEVVTQALLNTPVSAGDAQGDWTYVALSDYAGWVRTDELESPVVRGYCSADEGVCGIPLPYLAVVTAPYAPIYVHEQGEEQWDNVYLSTALPYVDLAHPHRLRLALPSGREGWLPRECASIRHRDRLFGLRPLHVVIDYSRAFLNVPYLWGGTTYRGIDCSGLVQLCYRMGGNILPRDADQQYAALTKTVSPMEMQEGDLLFFGRNNITHVALALNEHEYIHAEGQEFNRVTISSLDVQSPLYNERLTSLLYGIKRVR